MPQNSYPLSYPHPRCATEALRSTVGRTNNLYEVIQTNTFNLVLLVLQTVPKVKNVGIVPNFDKFWLRISDRQS